MPLKKPLSARLKATMTSSTAIMTMTGRTMIAPIPTSKMMARAMRPHRNRRVAMAMMTMQPKICAAAVWRLLGERNEPHAATAIRYGLANEDFSTIEFGAAEMSHIDIALAAQAAGPMEADALAKLAAAFRTA